MSFTSETVAAFKKKHADQPIYAPPKITNNASSSTSQSSTPKTSVTLSTSKKKKQKFGKFLDLKSLFTLIERLLKHCINFHFECLVYSQPTDTGVVKHTLSQLHNVIRFLKANNLFVAKIIFSLFFSSLYIFYYFYFYLLFKYNPVG
jgi:hypothetical protein